MPVGTLQIHVDEFVNFVRRKFPESVVVSLQGTAYLIITIPLPPLFAGEFESRPAPPPPPVPSVPEALDAPPPPVPAVPFCAPDALIPKPAPPPPTDVFNSVTPAPPIPPVPSVGVRPAAPAPPPPPPALLPELLLYPFAPAFPYATQLPAPSGSLIKDAAPLSALSFTFNVPELSPAPPPPEPPVFGVRVAAVPPPEPPPPPIASTESKNDGPPFAPVRPYPSTFP